MGNTKGVTVIELLVTIAVISMLIFLVSMSTATSMDEHMLKSAANMLAQDIRLTQQLAVSREDTYFFEIHITDNYYQIRSQSTGVYKKEYLHNSISISLTGFESPYTGSLKDLKILRYTSAGTPSTTGTITLKKGGLSKRITVMVGTGRVKLD